jgi:multicomponent Na+:H+ antiporter subunit D
MRSLLGAILGRRGSVNASDIEGVARLMPLTATLMFASGLAIAGAPLFASYTTISIALEALAQWDLQWVWIIVASVPAGLFMALCLRPALVAFNCLPSPAPWQEAPFPMLLGAALEFDPFAMDRVAPLLALLGATGATFLALRVLKLAPQEAPVRLRDVDALYRGPIAGAGRWLGVVLLRLYGTAQAFLHAQALSAGRLAMRWISACDQPYRGSGALQVVGLLGVTAIALAWRYF